jgi:hypothetical protein
MNFDSVLVIWLIVGVTNLTILKIIAVLYMWLWSSVLICAPDSKTEAYLHARDSYIDQFKKKAPTVSEDQSALNKLELQLKQIIGPVQIGGMDVPSKINLMTLTQDMGLGMLDGLALHVDKWDVVVTTKSLLSAFVGKELPLTCRAESLDELFTKAFSEDTKITAFSQLNLKHMDGIEPKCGSLALQAQDIGPFLPKVLTVYVQKGSLIYFAKSVATPTPSRMRTCESSWAKNMKQSEAFMDKYRSSALKETKFLDEAKAIEKKEFDFYKRCYAREFSKRALFKTLSTDAREIIGRLQQ